MTHECLWNNSSKLGVGGWRLQQLSGVKDHGLRWELKNLSGRGKGGCMRSKTDSGHWWWSWETYLSSAMTVALERSGSVWGDQGVGIEYSSWSCCKRLMLQCDRLWCRTLAWCNRLRVVLRRSELVLRQTDLWQSCAVLRQTHNAVQQTLAAVQ